MASGSHDITSEIKKFKGIYIGLLFLTVVTVAVSYLTVGVWAAITIALVIATFKASLVAGYFMHLFSEKKLIVTLIGCTIFFFISMMILIFAGQFNVPEGLQYLPTEQHVPEGSHHVS